MCLYRLNNGNYFYSLDTRCCLLTFISKCNRNQNKIMSMRSNKRKRDWNVRYYINDNDDDDDDDDDDEEDKQLIYNI